MKKITPTDQTARTAKDRQFVTSLARGLQILSCFSTKKPELSGSEIAKLTGLPQPTVWRLCYTMMKVGTLVSVPGDRMRPGLKVLQLGHSAISGLGVVELARPHLQELAESFGGACGIAAQNGLDMIYMDRCESKGQLHMNLRIGSAVPIASSSLGWAYIAGHTGDARENILQLLERERSTLWKESRAYCLQEIERFDDAGYVANLGHFHNAYNSIAVPIIAPNGTVQYAVNSGCATSTMTSKQLCKTIAPKLLSIAQSLRSLLAISNP